MPQKQVLKAKKTPTKKAAANRHGKTPSTRKGQFDKPPKKPALLETYKDAQALSKVINANNESKAAGKAQQGGGQLQVVRAPPPVLASAQQKKAMKDQKTAVGEEADAMDAD